MKGISNFVNLHWIYVLYRLLIAILHSNENYGREQAKTTNGQNKCGSVSQNQNRVNMLQSQSLLQKHTVSVVMWLLLMVQCIYLTGYVDELTAKAIQYCMKDGDDNHPHLHQTNCLQARNLSFLQKYALIKIHN